MSDDKKSLYEELGLSPDATQEEIRAAFRKRASATHPDKEGGNEEEFKRVGHAMAILGDPEKRERYDRTGSEDASDPAARNTAKAMEKLARHFDGLFSMAEFHPELHDPLTTLKKLVRMERKEAKKTLGALELRLAKMAKTIKRLRKKGTKKAEAKATKLEAVLKQLEKAALSTKAKLEREITVCDLALAMVDDCEYEVDEQAPSPEEQAAAEAVAALKKKIAAAAEKIKEPEEAAAQAAPEGRWSGTGDPFYKGPQR